MTICQVCTKPFEKQRMGQVVCSPRCAQKVPKVRAKAEWETTRKRKEAAKRPQELKKEAQGAFNAYIRYRDRNENCIDCGKPFEPSKPGGTVDAGHFRSVGSAPHLRFDERNCHAQRKNCNRPGGTTPDAYERGLVARIGQASVDDLKADQTEKHFKADDFRAIRDLYRGKLKALQ